MVRKTKEDTAATRESILDAAADVVLENGMLHATFQDVATAAGVTRGALYWHFGDKDGLVDALMRERAIRPFDAALQTLDRVTSDDPLRDLHDQLLSVLRRVGEDSRLRRIFELAVSKVELFDRASAAGQWHRECMRLWVMRAERPIEEAHRRGLLRDAVSVRAAAISTWVVIQGLIRMWMFEPHDVDLFKQGRCTVDALIGGLRSSPLGVAGAA